MKSFFKLLTLGKSNPNDSLTEVQHSLLNSGPVQLREKYIYLSLLHIQALNASLNFQIHLDCYTGP